MKTILFYTAMMSLQFVYAESMENPAIRYDQFLKLANDLQSTREKYRITEDEFIQISADSKTIILDARSKKYYDRIHVVSALNLPFTEFTAEQLAKVIPNQSTRILIYCNNNFENEPMNFARKNIAVSLNVQTFINLHAYGYTNVYELGPLLDVNTTKIPLKRSDSIQIQRLPMTQ